MLLLVFSCTYFNCSCAKKSPESGFTDTASDCLKSSLDRFVVEQGLRVCFLENILFIPLGNQNMQLILLESHKSLMSRKFQYATIIIIAYMCDNQIMNHIKNQFMISQSYLIYVTFSILGLHYSNVNYLLAVSRKRSLFHFIIHKSSQKKMKRFGGKVKNLEQVLSCLLCKIWFYS